MEFRTLTQGVASWGEPGETAFVAYDLRRTDAFSGWLPAENRSVLGEIDYARWVVIALFAPAPDSCSSVSVVKIERKKSALQVSAAVERRRASFGCLAAAQQTYHVVRVSRAALGKSRIRCFRLVVRREHPFGRKTQSVCVPDR